MTTPLRPLWAELKASPSATDDYRENGKQPTRNYRVNWSALNPKKRELLEKRRRLEGLSVRIVVLGTPWQSASKLPCRHQSRLGLTGSLWWLAAEKSLWPLLRGKVALKVTFFLISYNNLHEALRAPYYLPSARGEEVWLHSVANDILKRTDNSSSRVFSHIMSRFSCLW